jgi:hypothetical protein
VPFAERYPLPRIRLEVLLGEGVSLLLLKVIDRCHLVPVSRVVVEFPPIIYEAAADCHSQNIGRTPQVAESQRTRIVVIPGNLER